MKANYKEALALLTNTKEPTSNVIVKPLLDSLGFVISEDVYCIRDLPVFNNSALDGYAIKYEDKGKKLKIKETTIFAGVVIDEVLKNGECYKIMTGAKIPKDADTIVRFENIEEKDGYIMIPDNIKKGDAFRVKGEECKAGNLLVKKGTKILVSHIALLASQGIAYVKVYKKPKVLIFSTGNELKEPFEVASEDDFFNINAYTIISLLKLFDIEAEYGGIIKDSLGDLKNIFENVKKYDVVITSGGVSAGEADFIKEALSFNGFKPYFTSVNIKPGKPTVAGMIEQTLFISLPGNPLAAFFNAYVLAIPAIKKLSGEESFLHVNIKAKNKTYFKVNSGRTNIVLGFYENGEFNVTDNGKISSGMVEPLLRSNALLVLNEEFDEVEEGEFLDIFLIN